MTRLRIIDAMPRKDDTTQVSGMIVTEHLALVGFIYLGNSDAMTIAEDMIEAYNAVQVDKETRHG